MDCDESLCLDPEKLAEFCEKECKLEAQQLVHKKSGRVVKAVIVVHVFGNLADMEAIMSIAGEYHLKVVEDATEALGSHYTAGKGDMRGRLVISACIPSMETKSLRPAEEVLSLRDVQTKWSI